MWLSDAAAVRGCYGVCCGDQEEVYRVRGAKVGSWLRLWRRCWLEGMWIVEMGREHEAALAMMGSGKRLRMCLQGCFVL